MPRAPRTPRPIHNLRILGERVTRTTSRKALVFTGAGLALAGTGAAIATAGLSGTTASAAENNGLHRPAAAITSHAWARPGNSAQATRARSRGIVARQTALAHSASRAASHGANRAGGPAVRPRHAAGHAHTWAAVSRIVAKRTSPKVHAHGPLPAQDRLTPAGVSGPQTWMPMTQARYDNAKAIVRQALAKHMGVRAAVVAVATSMQESGLLNVNYGTSDSLGLFQQRPSMGWGSASQIMRPAYAADAFLKALRGYEARDPSWAHQPLWQSAQGVQASAYPYAYAKWEAQAAHLVAVITPHMV